VTHDARPIAPGGDASGWLGLEIMHQGVDWSVILALGDGTVRVRVPVGGPARKAAPIGLVTGDYVVSLNGKSYEALQADVPPIGSKVAVKAVRNGVVIWTEITVGRKPKPITKTLPPAVPCGAPVKRSERLQWLMRVTGMSGLTALDKALAARLMVRYVNRDGVAYPSIDRLAGDLDVTRSSIERAITRLCCAGFVAVTSGRAAGRSNNYTLTWPDAGNVIRLRPPS
jgi:hypothetical protein